MTLAEQIAVPTQGRELVVFIKHELDEGDAAAKDAASPYYERAGVGLIRAACGGDFDRRNEFWAWAKENFGRDQKKLRAYMEIAFENSDLAALGARQGDDLDDLLRRHSTVRQGKKRGGMGVYEATKKQTTGFASNAAYKAPAQQTSASKEKKLRVELCKLLIDTGYKALAVKLHPDKKTGDKEAMARLNAVRDLLKKAVQNA